MLISITSKRQATFPAAVLAELGVAPGSKIELVKVKEGFLLKPRKIDVSKLGTLRDKLKKPVKPFDVSKFREVGYDPYKFRN